MNLRYVWLLLNTICQLQKINVNIYQIQVIDQKTNTQLGLYMYELSALMLAEKMQVDPQPYDLIIDSKNQQHESKLIFCLQLKVCVCV